MDPDQPALSCIMVSIFAARSYEEVIQQTFRPGHNRCKRYLPGGHDLFARAHLIRITKICLCNVDPLKPQFYIVKLVYRGINYFSNFCSKI